MTTTAFSLRRPVGHVGHLAALGVGAISLFLGLFFSAQAGLLLLAGAWLAVLTWRYPWTSFLILIAVAPYLLILKATVVFGPITLLKDVVILTLAARLIRFETFQRVPAPLFAALAAFAGWAIVAFVRADSTVVGVLRLRDILLYLAAFPLALELIRTPERLRTFLKIFLGTGLVVLLVGVLQWFVFPDGMVLRFDAVQQRWIPRLSSVLAHPNHLGGFLLFLVPLSFAIALSKERRGARAATALLTAAGLMATYATYSRSAWIAVALAVAVVLFLWVLRVRPRLVRAGTAGVLALLIAGAFVPSVRERIQSYADPAYQSNTTRLEIFTNSLSDVTNRSAIIGEGLGDTVSLLGRDAPIELYDVIAADAQGAQLAKARTFVDNGVVKTWVEQGVVGLVLVGWIAVRMFVIALGSWRQSLAVERQAFGLAMTGILVGLTALWWLLDVPDMFPLNMYFWTFAGLLVSSGQWAVNSRNTEALRTAH